MLETRELGALVGPGDVTDDLLVVRGEMGEPGLRAFEGAISYYKQMVSVFAWFQGKRRGVPHRADECCGSSQLHAQ